ncbi:MAG TPA: polysaccharide deacetylase family protein, partial [Nitrospiria bacterium]|nr:polysaccharide deacetylase family protein [Nitrospiria bacterium]
MTKGQMVIGNNSKLRSLIKTGLSCGLHWTGADKLIGSFGGYRNTPLVIGYHRVVEDLPAYGGNGVPRMIISRRTLERQLDWIGRRFRFISLDELGEKLECGEKFDKPVAVITFDDGYSDIYYNAFPLLKQKGIPAGVFVVTDLIGASRLQIHDKLYLLLECAFSLWG